MYSIKVLTLNCKLVGKNKNVPQQKRGNKVRERRGENDINFLARDRKEALCFGSD